MAHVLAERARDEGEHAPPHAHAGKVVEGHGAHSERDTPAARRLENRIAHGAERGAVALDVGGLGLVRVRLRARARARVRARARARARAGVRVRARARARARARVRVRARARVNQHVSRVGSVRLTLEDIHLHIVSRQKVDREY